MEEEIDLSDSLVQTSRWIITAAIAVVISSVMSADLPLIVTFQYVLAVLLISVTSDLIVQLIVAKILSAKNINMLHAAIILGTTGIFLLGISNIDILISGLSTLNDYSGLLSAAVLYLAYQQMQFSKKNFASPEWTLASSEYDLIGPDDDPTPKVDIVLKNTGNGVARNVNVELRQLGPEELPNRGQRVIDRKTQQHDRINPGQRVPIEFKTTIGNPSGLSVELTCDGQEKRYFHISQEELGL